MPVPLGTVREAIRDWADEWLVKCLHHGWR
jgi:hypothetical protein